jgi:transporter family protein
LTQRQVSDRQGLEPALLPIRPISARLARPALISAAAAAATAILAKWGVEGVPSTLATALRTVVVSVFAWAMVVALGQHHAMPSLPRRPLAFLALSGIATGVSWRDYFRALQLAPASWVAPVDKLSLPLTIVIAALWLREPVGWQTMVGGADRAARRPDSAGTERFGSPPLFTSVQPQEPADATIGHRAVHRRTAPVDCHQRRP